MLKNGIKSAFCIMLALSCTLVSFALPCAALADKEGETPGGGPAASTVSSENAASEVSSKLPEVSPAPVLKGGVSETISPFAADGSKNDIPVGAQVNMRMVINVNSELSKVGDDVVAMVSTDAKQDGKTILPGQWLVHGTVTEVSGQKRLGRDGYVGVHFDKLVSPDGKFSIPIDASASTKQSTAKSVAKVVVKDSVMVGTGAVAGSWLSLQLTGVPLAVASHGYSVAIGAAAGAMIGLFGALHRKGNIVCGIPGEELKFRIDKPITLPAFNEAALPSVAPPPKIADLDISVDRHLFLKDPMGDKSSRLLQVHFSFENRTNREYSFENVVVVSDHNRMYYPYACSMDNMKQRSKHVAPKSSETGTITFDVEGKKAKYFLVLLDRANSAELARVPVN